MAAVNKMDFFSNCKVKTGTLYTMYLTEICWNIVESGVKHQNPNPWNLVQLDGNDLFNIFHVCYWNL